MHAGGRRGGAGAAGHAGNGRAEIRNRDVVRRALWCIPPAAQLDGWMDGWLARPPPSPPLPKPDGAPAAAAAASHSTGEIRLRLSLRPVACQACSTDGPKTRRFLRLLGE